jgi:hypothetical protein
MQNRIAKKKGTKNPPGVLKYKMSFVGQTRRCREDRLMHPVSGWLENSHDRLLVDIHEDDGYYKDNRSRDSACSLKCYVRTRTRRPV